MSLLHEGGLFFCFLKTLQLRFSFDGVHLISRLIDLIFVAGGFLYAFLNFGVGVDKYKSHDRAISKGPRVSFFDLFSSFFDFSAIF